MVSETQVVNRVAKFYCQPREMVNANVDLIDLIDEETPELLKNYAGSIDRLSIEFARLDLLQSHFPASIDCLA